MCDCMCKIKNQPESQGIIFKVQITWLIPHLLHLWLTENTHIALHLFRVPLFEGWARLTMAGPLSVSSARPRPDQYLYSKSFDTRCSVQIKSFCENLLLLCWKKKVNFNSEINKTERGSKLIRKAGNFFWIIKIFPVGKVYVESGIRMSGMELKTVNHVDGW